MRVSVSLLLLAAIACGGGAPTSPSVAVASPTPAPTASAVSIQVSPNPVVAIDSGDPSTPLLAMWTVKITSTASVGTTVNFVNATLRDASSGAEAEPSGILSLAGADITAQAGTNRLEPRGSITVGQSLQYSLPSGGRIGTLTVTTQCKDDNGNLASQTDQVTVN